VVKDRLGLGLLRRADQEGQATGGGDQRRGGGEDCVEALHGAEGYYVEGGGEGFGAGVLYIDVCQCKGAGDFAEEGGLLVVGLDQSERDVRGPELDGEAGESGAGAEVGDRIKGFHHRGHREHRGEEVAGGEEALAEVAGDDFFGVADGGEVDAGVPAEEYIDVCRYMVEVDGG
jgi:hypothetical protein